MYVTSIKVFFFFNDTATTEIYTLSLHDALPIYGRQGRGPLGGEGGVGEVLHEHGAFRSPIALPQPESVGARSEEHTSELQSRQYLVCRLLLEKKKSAPSPLLPLFFLFPSTPRPR